MMARVGGLERECGRGSGKELAGRCVEAGGVDCGWEARVEERWLGCYDSIDDEDVELDRIVCLGRLDGKWFCATMLVDGDGRAHGMMGCRQFRSLVLARDAMLHAH